MAWEPLACSLGMSKHRLKPSIEKESRTATAPLKCSGWGHANTSRSSPAPHLPKPNMAATLESSAPELQHPYHTCLLYTSDAADDLLCVDLGGRRIIKQK